MTTHTLSIPRTIPLGCREPQPVCGGGNADDLAQSSAVLQEQTRGPGLPQGRRGPAAALLHEEQLHAVDRIEGLVEMVVRVCVKVS